MVYTKHINIHKLKHLRHSKDYAEQAEKTLLEKTQDMSHLDNVFPYITNDDKTMSKQLVSGFGITNVYDAANEFIATKKLKAIAKGSGFELDPETGKMFFDTSSLENNNAILAHHLIQSFSPEDNLTPEQIHEIGRQTILEFTGEEHEFIIATHVDREHIHNHIIFNSTNLMTGKQFDWKVIQKGQTKSGKAFDVSKDKFEKVSDKIASKYGAKIIEKSPSTSHLKYTKWQTENLYKDKIKQRLNFLLDHSSTLEDFKIKAAALNLDVDFSGKWTTYKLLDEPQLKSTRSRTLDRSKSGKESQSNKYNIEHIQEHLSRNVGQFTVEDILERYEEKTNAIKNDFDIQVTIEPWQISHTTSKGIYLNVDFGAMYSGQIFIGGYKTERLENGNVALFLKNKDFFYFMNEEGADKNKNITGATLARQLSLYNGIVPLKKEPLISEINELVEAINFLAEHGVNKGTQLENLENKLHESLIQTKDRLELLDKKIIQLNQLAKLFLDDPESPELQKSIKEQRLLPDITLSELTQEIASIKSSRNLLNMKFETTVDEINQFNEIKAAAQEKTKETQHPSL
ncbi:relaxase/mobilization nuclease domain-containing protein [Lactococcus petauri]|uniref:relaxase/mobilization nuclease domain-containing protein n=1 Tax=Lactococcus petauri TaxID=1940789 RepID=UPI00289176B8|nr:relaxase/mobilization nuclease domain-containing protein [Lactococcus petauri]MDT2620868.1 relaxase/mobilization nuclease domain-containing protein [Lactococcus petauri]